MYTIKKLFEGEGWYSLHDVIVSVTDVSPTKEQTKELFLRLDQRVQDIAHQWGFSDSVFRDSAFEDIEEKNLKVNESLEPEKRTYLVLKSFKGDPIKKDYSFYETKNDIVEFEAVLMKSVLFDKVDLTEEDYERVFNLNLEDLNLNELIIIQIGDDELPLNVELDKWLMIYKKAISEMMKDRKN